MAQPTSRPAPAELPQWKSWVGLISAALLAIIMLVAGIWKLTSPLEAAARMNQALVPAALSLPAAIGFGIAETFCGILLLVPRYRRWGAWLGGLLLVAFMVYIGIFYDRLVGEECNCFPWIERAVGPAFFVSDAVMLVLAVLAGVWSPPSRGIKKALLVLAGVAVFASISLAVNLAAPHGKLAPATITADGQRLNLHEGRFLIYFIDPECTHCLFAARDMAGYQWKNVQIVVVPVEREFLAQQFLEASGLKAPVSNDVAKLREVYEFGDPPFAVAIEDGRTVAELRVFEGDEPKATLQGLGFIQ